MELRLVPPLLALLCIPPCEAHWKPNGLVGISSGWIRHTGEYGTDITVSNANVNINTVVGAIDHYHNNGAYGGIFAGYQFFCQGWILGAELDLEWDPVDHIRRFSPDNAPFIIDSQYSRGAVLGLSGRIGYLMAPYFMAYLRAGAEGSRDTLTTTFITATHSESTDATQNAIRGLGGIGAEFPLPCKLKAFAVRMEYNYHAQCRKITTEQATFNPQLRFSGNTRPKIHSFKAALVWNFG